MFVVVRTVVNSAASVANITTDFAYQASAKSYYQLTSAGAVETAIMRFNLAFQGVRRRSTISDDSQ